MFPFFFSIAVILNSSFFFLGILRNIGLNFTKNFEKLKINSQNFSQNYAFRRFSFFLELKVTFSFRLIKDFVNKKSEKSGSAGAESW